MKSIITAMGNPTLNNELRKYEKYDLICEDLFYQDAVIDMLELNDVQVLALSGVLQGQWELDEFIDRIKKKNNAIRIIIVMDELNSDVKCSLLEKEIQDIFLDDTVSVDDIISAIDRDEPLRKQLKESKALVREASINTYDSVKEQVVIRECQKQEIIAISGTNGAGKTTIAYNLSKNLADKSTSKILVIDLDTLSGNIDELFGINKVPQNIDIMIDSDKKCGLNYVADLISKNRFDSNVFEELVVHEGNVDILTGNTSLYFCQDVLGEDVYNKILECAKEKYDFIIIDTSSNIFLDSTKWALQKASKVLFVIESNYLNIKKCTQFLNITTEVWGIWKEKISLITNKETSNGLEKDLIEKILEGYKVIGNIRIGEENNSASYEKILELLSFMPKTKFIDKTVKNIQNMINQKLPKRLFGKGEKVNVN